jgi:uncharacterized protein (TIGR02246 family)
MTDTTETSLRDLYERLLMAWNSRDAETFAALFAPDGISIGFDGSQAQGSDIQEHLGSVFRDHPTGTYVAKVLDVRPLGTESALLRSMAGMIPPRHHNLNSEVNALHTLLAERDRDRENWRIVLFQNTPAQYHGRPDRVDAHTAELEQVRASDATIT